MTDILKENPEFLPPEMAAAEVSRAAFSIVTGLDVLYSLMSEYDVHSDDVREMISKSPADLLIGQMEYNCLIEVLNVLQSSVDADLKPLNP